MISGRIKQPAIGVLFACCAGCGKGTVDEPTASASARIVRIQGYREGADVGTGCALYSKGSAIWNHLEMSYPIVLTARPGDVVEVEHRLLGVDKQQVGSETFSDGDSEYWCSTRDTVGPEYLGTLNPPGRYRCLRSTSSTVARLVESDDILVSGNVSGYRTTLEIVDTGTMTYYFDESCIGASDGGADTSQLPNVNHVIELEAP